MKSVSFIIPMPGADCSPNTRAHWSKVHRAKKRSKLTTKAALSLCEVPEGLPVRAYQLHFTFPDNRRRDFDNFTARCKAALDAISDHVGNDDSEWDMKAPTREVSKGVNGVTITLFYKN